jgi:outer membrane protein
MKHFSKLFVFVLLAGIGTTVLAQQPFKFGHVNASELIQLMPERDSASSKLEAYTKELQEQIETMQVERNNKVSVFQSKQATWTTAIAEAKAREIQDLDQRIQEFQVTAQEDLQRMQQTLLRPVIEKANAAITKVGKDNAFTYIFDTSAGTVPYFSTEQSVDVLPLVKAELKIPADNKVPAAAAAR